MRGDAARSARVAGAASRLRNRGGGGRGLLNRGGRRARASRVCLLQIGIRGDGVAAIEAIARGAPETAVVVLTGTRGDGNVLASLRAGAVGYVFKSAEPKVLSAAVRAAARGEAVVPRPFLTKLLAEIADRERRRRFFADLRVPLTTREEEVLALLREGLTTAEIAGRPFVSQVTVRTHICSIVKKLEVPDRAAAVRLLSASVELVDEQGNIASEVAVGAPAALELARTGASATPAA